MLWIVVGRRKTGTVDGVHGFRPCTIKRGFPCFFCLCLHDCPPWLCLLRGFLLVRIGCAVHDLPVDIGGKG
jgi:hypothetical protein